MLCPSSESIPIHIFNLCVFSITTSLLLSLSFRSSIDASSARRRCCSVARRLSRRLEMTAMETGLPLTSSVLVVVVEEEEEEVEEVVCEGVVKEEAG